MVPTPLPGTNGEPNTQTSDGPSTMAAFTSLPNECTSDQECPFQRYARDGLVPFTVNAHTLLGELAAAVSTISPDGAANGTRVHPLPVFSQAVGLAEPSWANAH